MLTESRGGRGVLRRRLTVFFAAVGFEGWLDFSVAGFTSHITKFYPLSPHPPFPRGEGGDFWFISPGATAPGTPAPEPGQHWDRGSVSCADGGRGRSGGGLPWGRARTADYVSNSFGKSSWGFGGFFQEAPERFPAMVPGGEGLSRGGRERRTAPAIHSGKVLGGFGGFFQEAPERFPAMVPGGEGLSRGGRERRTAPAIHSGKVLGGLGASFKKPPTFLRFFVSSFLRIFSVIPHLRSADSMT